MQFRTPGEQFATLENQGFAGISATAGMQIFPDSRCISRAPRHVDCPLPRNAGEGWGVGGSSTDLDQRPRIHDPRRIEHAIHLPHQLDLRHTARVAQVGLLQQAYSVFGRNVAVLRD